MLPLPSMVPMGRRSGFVAGMINYFDQESWSRDKTVRRNMRSTLSVAGLAILVAAGTVAGQTVHAEIPRAWDDKTVEGFEVPLAQRDRSPRHLTADEYYKFKVRPIYRSYPRIRQGPGARGLPGISQAKGAGDRLRRFQTPH